MSQLFPPRRAIVLGASNVARQLPTVVRAAGLAWGQPLDLFIAAGLGRSYGQWNWVLGHSLPGIVHCGLWEAWDQRPPAPTAALITDVGNDLLYGAAATTILSWIETCLARLAPRCERIVIAQPPLLGLRRVTARQFHLLRTILYPWSRLTLTGAIDGAEAISDGLGRLAKKFSCPSVQPCEEWYGFDPIHVRRAFVPVAWSALLAPWRSSQSAQSARGSVWQALRLRRARVHRQRWCGWERTSAQPAMLLSGGSLLSLY